MPSDNHNKVKQFFFEDPENPDAAILNERDRNLFEKVFRELAGLFATIFDEVHALDDDETLTYLHSTISTRRHVVKTPPIPMYLDALLPDQPFVPGEVCMLGDYFIPTSTVNGFPNESFPAIIDELNHLPFEYRFSVRWICMDKSEAEKELGKYRRKWWAKRKSLWTMLKEEASKEPSALVDNDAANKKADIDAALMEFGEDLVAYGYMTTTIVVWDKDYRTAIDKMEQVKRVINGRGFTTKDENLNGKDAWLSSLPGHVYSNVRRPILNTLNLAHILPFSAVWSGDENDHFAKKFGVGTPHMICNTGSGTPFRMNQNVGDVGHMWMCGPTGKGKSTHLAMLEMQFLKYPNSKVIIFDKDRSARATTLAVGGDIYHPGSKSNIDGVSFQPLRFIDEEHELKWASGYIRNIFEMQNITVTPQLKIEVDKSLAKLGRDYDVQDRTMSGFQNLVQSIELREALQPFVSQSLVAGSEPGVYSSIFDANEDNIKDSRWLMFEMGDLMELDDLAIVATLDYLFFRLEALFRQPGPVLLVLDEVWYFLAYPRFQKMLKNWLKTKRKQDVYVVIATQEVADAADSPISSTIISSCATQIYLADEMATTPEIKGYYKRFGLTETEIYNLSTMTAKREYFYKSTKGRRIYDMDLGPVSLSFAGLSGDADHVFMDQMVSNPNIPKSEYAKELLKYTGQEWAVDLYNQGVDRIQDSKYVETVIG